MAEKRILSAMMDSRNVYGVVRKHGEADDFSDLAKLLVDNIKEYYERDPDAKKVDVESLKELIKIGHPRHYERLHRLLDTLPEVSSPNIAKLWLEFKIESAKTRLTEEILSGNTGSEELDRYKALLATSEQDILGEDEEDLVMIGAPMDKIFSYYEKDSLSPLFPSSLNEVLGGGVPDGTNILIYATPETGKTAFAVNQACGMARLGHRVLYVGNEDPGPSILARIMSNLTGAPREKILDNQERAYELAVERGYNNIIFAPLTPGDFPTIEEIVVEHDPKMIIIDQLHNLNPGKSLGKVEELFFLATQARELGKRTGKTIMSFTQADENAINKKILDIGNVYYSNIGVQQAMDIMIGIGMSSEDARTNIRYLSLTKNKHTGVHEPIRVRIDPLLSRFMS